MNPYLLHLRHSIFVLIAPVLAVAGALIAWNASYPSVASSVNIANVVVSTGAVVAPVLAGFAAWDGLRERRHGGAPVLDVAVQPPARIVLVQVAVGLTYTALIFVVIVAVLYARGLLFTIADPPLWANLGVALLTLCLASTWGYLSAGVVKHWGALIVAAALPTLIYGYSLLGQSSTLVSGLVPFGNRAGTDYLDANRLFFLGQLLFLTGLLGLLIGITAARSRSDRWWGSIAAVTALVVAGSGVWIVDSQHGRWGTPVADPGARLVEMTSTDGELTLSVLPTYLPVEQDLLSRWSRVQYLLAETPAAFGALIQLTDAHPESPSTVEPLHIIYVNPSSPSIAMHSVLESLMDLHTSSCDQAITFETSLVDIWLAGEGAETQAQLMPEHAEALSALRALSEDEAQTWMTENFDAFASCSITLAELPVS